MSQGNLFTPQTGNGAVISPCGRYRYMLTRCWSAGIPPLYWIMCNPSTADATADDPTIRRCIAFSHHWGYGGLAVVNLFALRAKDPGALRTAEDPVGPQNDGILRQLGPAANRDVVCAWGVHGILRNRDLDVIALLGGRKLLCLGTTRGGFPRHPLYAPAAAPLLTFTPPTAAGRAGAA